MKKESFAGAIIGKFIGAASALEVAPIRSIIHQEKEAIYYCKNPLISL